MSSERIKAAAELLRARAEGATAGPWTAEVVSPPDGFEDYGDVADVTALGSTPRSIIGVADELAVEDATFIATMHPGVALALADWLMEEVARADERDPYFFPLPALAIADAVLGPVSGPPSGPGLGPGPGPVSSAVEGAGCRCTMLSPQTHIEPADWEQAGDCPVHPLTPVAGHEQEVRADSLIAMLHAQREWSAVTFGPGSRLDGLLDHLEKELREVREKPTDVTEWIDVAILAFDGAWRAGHDPEDIVAALLAKYAKNRARTWPDWRTADPDKAIEHVRASGSSAPVQGDGA